MFLYNIMLYLRGSWAIITSIIVILATIIVIIILIMLLINFCGPPELGTILYKKNIDVIHKSKGEEVGFRIRQIMKICFLVLLPMVLIWFSL